MRRLSGAFARAVRLGAIITALVALNATGVFSSLAQAEQTESGQVAARNTLRQAGLDEVDGRWLSLAEQRLLARFVAVDSWQIEAREARQALRKIAAAQRRIQADIDNRVAAQQQLQAALTAQPGQLQLKQRLQQVGAQLDALRKQRISARELAARPEVRRQTTRLISACHRALLLQAGASQRSRDIHEAYDRLSEDESIAAALAELGVTEPLGSGQNFGEKQQQLAAAIQAMMPQRWPVYAENNWWRTSIMIRGRHAAAVKIKRDTPEQPYPIWLPASTLRAAGVAIPPTSPHLELRLPDGRRVPTRVLQLAYLRIGPHRLGGVEILALRPEDEDLGGQIGLQFLAKQGLQLDESYLPAVISK